MSEALKAYYVISPSYTTGGSFYEPPEPCADCIVIEAESKRDAIILGVKEILRTQRHSWADYNRSSNLPPWAGYWAQEKPHD